jgi:hypothetical protein
MAYHHLPPSWRHFSEPEILPPGEDGGREPGHPFWGRDSFDERSVHRIYVTRIGPFALLPYALLGGGIAIVFLAFLFGFLLILLPVAGLVLAAAIIGSFLRGSRWRRW